MPNHVIEGVERVGCCVYWAKIVKWRMGKIYNLAGTACQIELDV